MFFYITHKSPLWRQLKPRERNTRVFLVGIVLYVIFHSFLHSGYGVGISLKKYLYYILGADILLTGLAVASDSMFSRKKLVYPQHTYMLPYAPPRLIQQQPQHPQHPQPQQHPQQQQQPQPQPQQHPQPQPQPQLQPANDHQNGHIPIYRSTTPNIPVYRSKTTDQPNNAPIKENEK